MRLSHLATVVLLAAAMLSGCDDKAGTPPAPQAPSFPEPTRTVEVVPVEAAEFQTFALSLPDIDVFEKGLSAENAHIRAAQAESGLDSVARYVATLPEQTEPAGAEAAAVPVEHYRNVKQTILEVLYKLDVQSRDHATGEGNAVLHPSVAGVQAALDDPYAGIDTVVATALRAGHARLEALRSEHLTLLAQTSDQPPTSD